VATTSLIFTDNYSAQLRQTQKITPRSSEKQKIKTARMGQLYFVSVTFGKFSIKAIKHKICLPFSWAFSNYNLGIPSI